MLTDEIIAQLWYESNNQYHKFARLIEAFTIINYSKSLESSTIATIKTQK